MARESTATLTEWLYVYSSKFLIRVRARMASRFWLSMPLMALTTRTDSLPDGIRPRRISLSTETTTLTASW